MENIINIDEVFATEIERNDYFNTPHYRLSHSSNVVIGHKVRGYVHEYGFGFCGSDALTRKRDGGPIEAGPHAYIFGHGVVLTAWKEEPKKTVMVEPGDFVIMGGHKYAVSAERNDNLGLTLVTE
jgi:hypothetical protein